MRAVLTLIVLGALLVFGIGHGATSTTLYGYYQTFTPPSTINTQGE